MAFNEMTIFFEPWTPLLCETDDENALSELTSDLAKFAVITAEKLYSDKVLAYALQKTRDNISREKTLCKDSGLEILVHLYPTRAITKAMDEFKCHAETTARFIVNVTPEPVAVPPGCRILPMSDLAALRDDAAMERIYAMGKGTPIALCEGRVLTQLATRDIMRG